MAQVLKLQLCSVRTPPHNTHGGYFKVVRECTQTLYSCLNRLRTISSSQKPRGNVERSLCVLCHFSGAPTHFSHANDCETTAFKTVHLNSTVKESGSSSDWSMTENFLRVIISVWRDCATYLLLLKTQQNFLYLHGKHTSQLISTWSL